jgi:hypothetical protein
VIDVYRANDVEIRLVVASDGARLWVHVDGQLIVRVYRIRNVILEDLRINLED